MSAQQTSQEVILNDPKVIPSDVVIGSYLGKRMPLWLTFMEQLGEMSLAGEWRYYNDGKRWLFKVTTKKAKTACWVSLRDSAFRVTCYFGDKAADAVAKSDLPDELKRQFADGKRYGKIRGITVCIKRKEDLVATRSLLELKDRVK